MTQSQQQQQERKFIAVDFRGIQPMARERTALAVAGPAGLEVLAALPEPPPELESVEPDATPRPPLGLVGNVAFGLGGEAARAAYTYAALGGLASLAGRVGDDSAGDVVLQWLAGRGVETSSVVRRGATPVVVVLGVSGYRPIAITGDAPGADAAPGAAPDLERALARLAPSGQGTGTLLLAGFPYELRGEAVVAALRKAGQRRVRVVVSLSPVALGGPGAPLSPEDLEPLLPEVGLICGGPAELRRATRRSDPAEAARALIAGGARAVLAKRGPDGATLFRPGPAALEREDTPTPAIATTLQAVDRLRLAAAFGAVFDAAYLLGVAFNDPSPVRFAAAAAARVATSPRGILGL